MIGGRPLVAAVVAGVIVVAAVGSGAWVVAGERPGPVALGDLCVQYVDMRSRLDLTGADGQFGLRRSATRLARMAKNYPAPRSAGVWSAHSAAESLESVLRAPYASARDLRTAGLPVAVACGDDWRVGSPASDRLNWLHP